ncbi:MAG: hypothetical protein AAGE52_35105 [Myxococcota bacterium]
MARLGCWVLIGCLGCSGSDSSAASETHEPTTAAMSAMSETAMSESAMSESAMSELAMSESAMSESAMSESAMSEGEVVPNEVVRAPQGPLAPPLSSVRWGPDRREPEDTLEALDSVARAHFARPARVAGRLRARHNRERISLALVVVVDQESFDEASDPDALIGFGLEGASTDEPAPEVQRRPPNVDSCTCEADFETELYLMRVVHGAEPEIASIKLVTICTGRSFDGRLGDFDGDDRVEARFDIVFETEVNCSVREEVITQLVVVDVADLAVQVNIPRARLETHYYESREAFTRARFRDLNEDGRKDLEVLGRSVEEDHGRMTRVPIERQYLYDAATDRWITP